MCARTPEPLIRGVGYEHSKRIFPAGLVCGDLHIGLNNEPASLLGCRASIRRTKGHYRSRECRDELRSRRGHSARILDTGKLDPLRRLRLIDRNLIPTAIAF